MTTRYGFIRNEKKDTLSGSLMRTYQHISGMNITFVPKSGFSKKFAAILIPYGSIHTKFYESGENEEGREPVTVPAGTAHYLEHCVFSRNEDGDGGLLGRLATFGAQANAYTTYTHTLYYFSTVDHFSEALQLYLRAISNPPLNDERVEAERDIIAAELNMYRDDPDNVAFNRLMGNLFLEHGAREDIGGTVDSIRSITSDHLRTVHRNFYAPNFQSLVLAGDFDDDYIMDLLETLDRELPDSSVAWPADPIMGVEQPRTARYSETVRADVAAESFLLGYKDSHVNALTKSGGCNLMMHQLAGQLYIDSIIGAATPLYEKLYAEGVINDSFSVSYMRESDFAFVLVGGESENPEASADAVHQALTEAVRSGTIDEDLFDLQKKVVTGQFIRSLDSVDAAGMTAAHCRLNNIDLFDYSGVFSRIDLDDTIATMDFLSDQDIFSRIIVKKLKES
ncbi:MAG: EF-P 5-aminopentanol modification-associated protein YfmH [Fastidiosipilaceae bacterium]|jgi:predicted Zn-dependent peptidase